jgi:hypothetical protein
VYMNAVYSCVSLTVFVLVKQNVTWDCRAAIRPLEVSRTNFDQLAFQTHLRSHKSTTYVSLLRQRCMESHT